MKYGICMQSLVPVRFQPGDKQEMINQLLFGDQIFIKGQVKEWVLVQTLDDEYEGWVDRKQVEIISKEEFKELLNADDYYSLELASRVLSEDGQTNLMFTLGARLPGYNLNRFQVNGNVFLFPGDTCSNRENASPGHILLYAEKYLDAPYLWGGRSPFGIDCSGLVQMVFKMGGVLLPRDSSQQMNMGSPVNFIHEAQPGGLAFFGEEEGDITHVGIITGNGSIIHASGKVRVDHIDHQGIFNAIENKYTHHLRVIKHILT